MNESHQDKIGIKLTARLRATKTIFVLVVYCLAIALLTACAITIVVKLIFWPPCTDTGKNCVIDPWSVVGLTAAILGVAATVLAILGAVAVAAWWGYLDDRVTRRVNDLFIARVKVIEMEIRTETNKLILKHLVSDNELTHLNNLKGDGAFFAENSGEFIPELRHLLLMGCIERQHDRGFRSLQEAFWQYGRVNVKDYFIITETGKAYLKQVE